jgi:hypothetical protein
MNLIYEGEVFYLDNKWGWLNANFVLVSSDLQVKLNDYLEAGIAEAVASLGN